MEIEQSLLLKIKTNLRIRHTALDEDLSDTIAACLADLKVCGIQAPAQDGTKDLPPLILSAVKLYCRKEYTDDPAKAAEYGRRYDAQKSSLMMATGYREVDQNE